jgi:predicted transcriptional regulator
MFPAGKYINIRKEEYNDMLNKSIYDVYGGLMKDAKYDELAERLKEENAHLMVEYVQDYLENRGKTIKKDFHTQEIFKQLLLPAVQNELSYQIGVISTMLTLFELLVSQSEKKVSFTKRIKALNEKSNVNAILSYLYKHPDSQHKVVSENVGLKPNYLSELMRELEKTDCVIRYGVGKRSFYSLTIEANKFMRSVEEKKRERVMERKFGCEEKYNVPQVFVVYNKNPRRDIGKYNTTYGLYPEHAVPYPNKILQLN